MFYSFNGRYIWYSDLDLSRLVDKINQSSFIILTSYSYDFWFNVDSNYKLSDKCAVAISNIEEIKEIKDEPKGIDKEWLEISFK